MSAWLYRLQSTMEVNKENDPFRTSGPVVSSTPPLCGRVAGGVHPCSRAFVRPREDTMLSTVRIQAEIMLWLIITEAVLRRAFALFLPDAPLVGEGQNTWKEAWREGAMLLESASTISLMLWILHWRFSPGKNTRACFLRNGAPYQSIRYHHTRPDCHFVNKVALSLASLAVAGVAAGILLGEASLPNFHSSPSFGSRAVGTSKAAVTSMVRDPILEETFYRGVVFDRLLVRHHQTNGHDGVLKAACGSSFLFGGVHLFMHLFREGAGLSWVDYYQALFATGAGYVYCLLYFLSGGRLLPTIFLHSVNNIAASFAEYGPSRITATYFPTCDIGNRQAVGHKLNGVVDENSIPTTWVTYTGLLATVVAYWCVGSACSSRIISRSNRRRCF